MKREKLIKIQTEMLDRKHNRKTCKLSKLKKLETDIVARICSTLTPSELLVFQHLKDKGVKVYRNGWPDFLAVSDGKVSFLEVKAGHAGLSPRQRVMHKLLKGLGLSVQTINTDSQGWQARLGTLL